MAVKLSKNEDINVMIHLTSILHKKDDIERMLSNYCEEGIENILALRGDAPKGEIVDYKNQELPYAEELIKFINEKFSSKFSIGGAAFPEGHPESKNIDEEMYYFKRKCEAGMKFAITQLFFDNNKYFNYMERCKKNNIEIDIIPGIMPITAYSQIDKFIAMCKVEIPLKLREKLEKYKDNKDAVEEIGVEFATKQCMILLENGVKGIHFYTLNKSKATQKIYENIKNMI
jgi:methylenetetrahydrofolate reductase (NADPH)